MKKENWFILIIVLVVGAFLVWPHVRASYAIFKDATGGRKRVVNGTAQKGNDSGGVLTSAEVQ